MRKNIIFAALSSLAVVFAVSCVKETPVTTPEGSQVEPGFKEVTLTAEIPSKVISVNETMKWLTAAEKLAVFGQIGDAMVKYQFEKPRLDGVTTKAEFKGTVSENAVLKYAAYPYNDDDSKCSCTTDGVFTLFSKESQANNANNSVPNDVSLYAVIEGETVTMKSACAYLKIALPGPTTTGQTIYESVKVAAPNVSGAFTVNCSKGTPVISGGTSNKITITMTKRHSGVYVPVIPGTYNDITITVNYNDGYPAFVKQSTKPQTFEAGKYYDCKEVAGARVTDVTSGSYTIEGTSLTMNASAVVWKYSDVTNEAYTAKFFYAEQGVEKGAAGWNEVEATISGNEGNNVTLSATATIEAGKSYQYYAQVSDGTMTLESEATNAIEKVIKTVEFNFTGDDEGWTYTDPAAGEMVGAYKIVDENGNDIFPTVYPGNKTDKPYYYKVWDGQTYGEVRSDPGTAPTKMVGGTLTKTVDGVDFQLSLSPTTTSYYTYYSAKLCSNNKYTIQMLCPEGYKITQVRLQVAANSNCAWGIGSTGNSADIIDATNYKDKVNAVNELLVIPDATANTPYYLHSAVDNNRLGSLTITYEK